MLSFNPITEQNNVSPANINGLEHNEYEYVCGGHYTLHANWSYSRHQGRHRHICIWYRDIFDTVLQNLKDIFGTNTTQQTISK